MRCSFTETFIHILYYSVWLSFHQLCLENFSLPFATDGAPELLWYHNQREYFSDDISFSSPSEPLTGPLWCGCVILCLLNYRNHPSVSLVASLCLWNLRPVKRNLSPECKQPGQLPSLQHNSAQCNLYFVHFAKLRFKNKVLCHDRQVSQTLRL